MHKKCNFYPLSLFYLGILYKDFKNQWNLSRTRRRKRSTIITEQRFKNVFFDGKENNSIVLFFIIFLILNLILIWLCPIFRKRLHVYTKKMLTLSLPFVEIMNLIVDANQ